MKQIHWYPGHMKKAQNEIQEKLKVVDILIELLDARIPLSSRNQTLYEITKSKPRLVVLTKIDLADPEISNEWISFFKENNVDCIFANLNQDSDIKTIIKNAEKLGSFNNEKLISKGMKPQPIRAMVLGIPNVGKSTLINKISKRNAASVQNKPGHTKGQQWIKVSDKFELLDTPGVLPPNYENQNIAINLALTGSINEIILPSEDLAKIAFAYLLKNYKNELLARYSYLDLEKSFEENISLIANKRGYLVKGGQDIDKTCKVFLNELKNGVIGRISFERK